jgi:membrane-associated phospholipid phosphatase
MKLLFYNLFKNILALFRGTNLVWQIVFCALTYVLVASGFDWWYFEHTRGAFIQALLFPPVVLGSFIPVIMSVAFWMYGALRKHSRAMNAGFATAQAGFLGLGVSSFYKVFTGRMGPHGFRNVTGVLTDISHGFRFGFYRGGAFQGWPSSHTSVAFAMSAALVVLYPENTLRSKIIRVVAIVYAAYIGIGVSVNIHWFSDFVAGTILGCIIGFTVGKAFYTKWRAATA